MLCNSPVDGRAELVWITLELKVSSSVWISTRMAVASGRWASTEEVDGDGMLHRSRGVSGVDQIMTCR